MIDGSSTSTTKALRKQVLAEVRLKRYFWNALLSFVLITMIGTMVFGDMGLLRYLDLKERQGRIEKELNSIMQDNLRTSARLDSIKEDNYFIEKHARESFGMASKDEYIFIFK